MIGIVDYGIGNLRSVQKAFQHVGGEAVFVRTPEEIARVDALVLPGGVENGDAMRDPEMGFELGLAGGAHLNPYYWRNDYVGIEQWSRFIQESNYCFHTQLHEQHARFAKTWDNNLRLQGFAEVFTDKCIVG